MEHGARAMVSQMEEPRSGGGGVAFRRTRNRGEGGTDSRIANRGVGGTVQEVGRAEGW